MGYQFVHVECYARTAGSGKAGGRTLRDVVAEAERTPEACPHIALVRPPVLLHGVMPSAAATQAEQRAAGAKDAAGRKLRKDGLCMVGGVASYPEPWDSVDADADAGARWSAWEAATVAWLTQEYGDRLVSVVRHEDEPHPHVHFYALPDVGADGRLRISDVHAGRRAAEEAKAAGAVKGAQNEAYKGAMREYQHRYWQAVGVGHGLTRLGPGRRRLTRGEWKAEQTAAAATAEALRAAEAAATREARAVDAVERARAVFAEAKAGAVKAQAAAEAADAARRQAEADARSKARSVLSKARVDGRRLLEEAEARAAPLRRVGGLLGAVWSGFRGVEARLRAAADAKVAEARTAASAEVAKAKDVLRAEARQAVRDELAELRRAAERADRDRRDAEARAAKAEAVARSKADELRQATSALSGEWSARRAAEAERERFRGKWADADNALLALKASPGPRPSRR
jgi:hypothetical protein